VSRAFEEEYAISRAIDRPLWLSGFFLQPGYGERPWLIWEANGSRVLEGVSHSAPWLVLRP
jgi:lysozyme